MSGSDSGPDAFEAETLGETLSEGVLVGQRRALAKAITLVESSAPAHRRQADVLLERVLPQTGKAVRLGISGVPGVGKSTFIEAFGGYLIDQGKKVAVLAVDPTSRQSRGSILGDKTRMERLSRDPYAFVRPSPAGETLGGVARRTREAMLLCEAAGFDVVLVETVGVGQSETAVSEMVDMFMLLLLPGGGDELQGIKRGIVELADAVIVNKADGDMAAAAKRAAAEYHGALGLIRSARPDWRPPVLQISALENRGVDQVWQTVGRYLDQMNQTGALEKRRRGQALSWMWSEIQDSLLEEFRRHPGVAHQLEEMEQAVATGKAAPGTAARALMRKFFAA